jgi:metal-dependent hydrolase (beta-lactamase superfamily II)
VVDGFRFTHPSATAYFLTHAHSDHYQGLSDSWQARRARAQRVARGACLRNCLLRVCASC